MKYSTDLWLNAYLLLKEIPISSYELVERGKVRLYFNLSDEEWKRLKLEFSNSDFSKMKFMVEKIKDLSY